MPGSTAFSTLFSISETKSAYCFFKVLYWKNKIPYCSNEKRIPFFRLSGMQKKLKDTYLSARIVFCGLRKASAVHFYYICSYIMKLIKF